MSISYPKSLKRDTPNVMAALVAAIHIFARPAKTWMAGTCPAMTLGGYDARSIDGGH